MVHADEPRGRTLRLNAGSEEAGRVLKALASDPRLRVLELLKDRVCNVSEIATELDIPLSTATLHITALEEAGLVTSEHQSAARGRQKICSRVYDMILVELPRGRLATEEMVESAMPIGAYVDYDVTPSCGLASQDGIIGLFDDPTSFYEPQRIRATILWFRQGYVEYRFPNRLPSDATLDSLRLSLELCSEAPLHHSDWPSDISVWINGVELGQWTSPSDFGGNRGVLTPAWWESWNSQYGLLKEWQVNREGSFVDGIGISDVTVNQLGIEQQPYIAVRIGVKADVRHIGGINIFGQGAGNYPQDIMLRLRYR